ncbi:MAG: hypothetical protein DRI48_07705, partial [Chloroflexi bacterium]
MIVQRRWTAPVTGKLLHRDGGMSQVGSEGTRLPIEEQGLLRWLRRYVQLRWLAVGAVLIGVSAARFVLSVGVPLVPVVSVAAAIAFYNFLF